MGRYLEETREPELGPLGGGHVPRQNASGRDQLPNAFVAESHHFVFFVHRFLSEAARVLNDRQFLALELELRLLGHGDQARQQLVLGRAERLPHHVVVEFQFGVNLVDPARGHDDGVVPLSCEAAAD